MEEQSNFGNHLDGNLDVADQLLQMTVLHHGLQVVGDLDRKSTRLNSSH